MKLEHFFLYVARGKQIVDITGDQRKYHQEPLKNNVPVYIRPSIHPSGVQKHIGLNDQWPNCFELRQWYESIIKHL